MQQAVALFADWANGICAVIFAAWVTGTEVVWWHFLIGILLSHSPDIDAIPELFRRGRVSASATHEHDHRTFLHYPIISLPLGGLAWSLFGYWGLVWLGAVVLHLLNDLYGTGWGIRAAWPFSQRAYKVAARRVNRLRFMLVHDGDWESLTPSERRLRAVISWSADELPHYIRRWGVDDWIPRWYGNLNWVSGIEYGTFIVACIAMYVVLSG